MMAFCLLMMANGQLLFVDCGLLMAFAIGRWQSSYGLKATGHEPRATAHGLKATGHEPRATSHGPQATSLSNSSPKPSAASSCHRSRGMRLTRKAMLPAWRPSLGTGRLRRGAKSGKRERKGERGSGDLGVPSQLTGAIYSLCQALQHPSHLPFSRQ